MHAYFTSGDHIVCMIQYLVRKEQERRVLRYFKCSAIFFQHRCFVMDTTKLFLTNLYNKWSPEMNFVQYNQALILIPIEAISSLS